MLMKSSSGINIGNGNKCRENQKTSTTSPSSSSSSSSSAYINKRVTKTNTGLLKSSNTHSNDIQQQQLNDFIQPAQSFYTNSLSSFQSESLSSKFKFEITPETVRQLNKKYQTNKFEHQPRIKWITHHTSLHSKPNVSNTTTTTSSSLILSTSSIDLNSTTTMTTDLKEEILDLPNVSITELTVKDFNDEYQQNPSPDDEIDQTIPCTSIPVATDDDANNNNNNKEKTFVDQSSQAVLIEIKRKKKVKSPNQQRKTKSATRRPKAPSATQLPPPPPTASSVSPTRLNSQLDLTTGTKLTVLTTKIEENSAGKTLITVDTTKARSNLDVVRLCIKDLGWKECSTTTTLDSDIYWHSSAFHEGNTPFTSTSGRVNKFPGMNDLLRKVHLTRSLNNMRLLYANDFDFYPKTWFLPEQNQQFKDDVRYIHQLDRKHNRPLTTFIVKPSDGSQGEGIYLLRDPAHCIVTNRPHVVQEYIERPLLINGLKFDLRIYVLILNLYPLEIFLYDEGLVRFATVDYKAPSTDNLHQTFMHLTNYSLNKRSATYKHALDNSQTDGSKRKLTSVWTQLIQMYGNDKIDRTKVLITEMINKTVLAILPELRVEYEFELPLGKKQNISCFQIVGFDIILTENLKPILLEVNANPSLRIDFDKESETGKLVYQPSPIDEEIKKPLVLETLKLAIPKKKLHTFTRHAQSQYNDELMAQRVEKVAQRRVVERNEKIKSERKTRFDLKSNPFFSRPPETISKDFQRLQQEQQEHIPQQRVLITTPTNLNESSTQFTTTTVISNNSTLPKSPSPRSSPSPPRIDTKSKQITSKIVRKTRKTLDSTDDDESGTPGTSIHEGSHYQSRSGLYHSTSASIRRPILKSASSRHMSTSDATMISSIKKLKMIFPIHYKSKYRHLFLLDKIAYIYIQLVIMLGHKTMTGGQFRSFANICGITNETITAPSIDILYYQILRKWQQFVLRSTTSTGLPFSAFIEAFFLLSQRKYPTSHSLLDSVSQLVNVCVRNLNNCLQAPSSPLIQQSNQYLLHRATRINSSINPTSSMNNRSSFVALRSTTTATNRLLTAPSSAPTPRTQQLLSSATTTTSTLTTMATNNSEEKIRQNSAKSVFPLFFDVL